MDGKKQLAQKYDFNQLNVIIKQYFKHQIEVETQTHGANSQSVLGLQRVLETFENEEKEKQGTNIVSKFSEFQLNKVPQKKEEVQRFPVIYQAYMQEQDYQKALTQSKHNPQPHDHSKIDIDPPLSDKEKKLSYQHSILQRQHGSVLQSARQIFSIAINCLQQLHNIKDGNVIADPASLAETIENYKIQLDKYDQILSSEGRADRTKLFSEAVMTEHKNKLIQAKQQGNVKGVIEVLLSLRVNALQISPELRKNLIYELVRNDVFLLQSSVSDQFLLDLLNINQPAMQHAILSLISVMASTLKGVEYLMTNGKKILISLIHILKELSKQRATASNPIANSVNTRFCIAIMQKMSIKSQLSPIFIENNVIDFILDRLEDHYKSSAKNINPKTKQPEGLQHVFFLDFSTALLANILHSKITQDWLVKNSKQLISISNRLLNCLMQPRIPTSTLIHILIALSYLNKTEALRNIVEGNEVQFSDKVSSFVEMFSKQPLNERNMEDRTVQTNVDNGPQQLDDENGDIDKRTILDLCAYMFHPNRTGGANDKDNNNLDDSDEQFIQSYEVGEFNDMRTDDRIKEFENEQGDLIFECFQDEEHMFQ